MSRMIAQVWVEGRPRPQGSKTATVRNGRVVMWESSKGLAGWREAVRANLDRINPNQLTYILRGQACSVNMCFMLKKAPTSKLGPHPIGKPDLDKLSRAVLDCLTECRWIHDDSQVIELSARKIWTDSGDGPNELSEGVLIELWEEGWTK